MDIQKQMTACGAAGGLGMTVAKNTDVTKTFFAFDPGDNQSLVYRLFRLICLDGPLCPLPSPERNQMAADIEQMRRQQVHVDEIKRLCHVPTPG